MAAITGLMDPDSVITTRFAELVLRDERTTKAYNELEVNRILFPYSPRVQYKDFAFVLNKLFNKKLTEFVRECGFTVSIPEDYLDFVKHVELVSEGNRLQILKMIDKGYFGTPWWNYASRMDNRERMNAYIDHQTTPAMRKRNVASMTDNIFKVRPSPTSVCHFDTMLDMVNIFHISFRWLCGTEGDPKDMSDLPYVDSIYDAYTMMQTYNFENPNQPIPNRNQIILRETVNACLRGG